MANETLGLTYREITDSPSDNAGCDWFISGCLFVISVPLIILAVFAFIFNWQVLKWIFFSLALLFLVWAVKERLSFCKLPKKLDACLDRPSPRLQEAQKAKDFFGFDFGSVFKLRKTGSHDYDEILLDFDEKDFEPIKKYCEKLTESANQIMTENEITITEIKNHIITKEGCTYLGIEPITKRGFTKIESYFDPNLSKDGSLWITFRKKVEVDYENRTLKMSWTGW